MLRFASRISETLPGWCQRHGTLRCSKCEANGKVERLASKVEAMGCSLAVGCSKSHNKHDKKCPIELAKMIRHDLMED